MEHPITQSHSVLSPPPPPSSFFSTLKANSPLKVNKVAFSSRLQMDHSLGAPLVSSVV